MAFTPVYREDDAQEQYLNGFSWGPGCGIYFWSNAMYRFLLMMMALNAISGITQVVAQGISDADVAASIGVGLVSLLILALAVGLLVWAGRVARRQRWQILKWRDFEHFRQDENSWNLFGAIGWGLFVLTVIGSFIMGIGEGLSQAP